MLLSALLASFLALTPSLALKLAPRTTRYTNNTIPTTTSSFNPVASNCCFVVQDVVSEHYWQEYASTEITQVYRITSIITLIIPYADTIITNYTTKIHTSNKVYGTVVPSGEDPISLVGNGAPAPAEVTSTIMKGNQIVTGGVTVHSPTAFFIISSVKIITVPAVTDSRGNAVCVTTSIAATELIYTEVIGAHRTVTSFNGTSTKVRTVDFASDTIVTAQQTVLVTGVNSNAEAYFGGYNISDNNILSSTKIIKGYSTHVVTKSENGTKFMTTKTKTLHDESYVTIWIRTDGETFVYTPATTGTIITFPTPYVYLPPWGFSSGCSQSGSNDPYGYVPQTVLDYMVSNPAISSQYPGISACLPGGPSILQQTPECSADFTRPPSLPYDQLTVSDLTSSTVSTVYGWESSYALGHSGQVSATSSGANTTPSPNAPLVSPDLIQASPTSTPQRPQNSPSVTTPPDSPTITSATPVMPWLGSIIASIFGIPQFTSTSATPPAASSSIPLPLNPLLLPTTTISDSIFLELSPTTVAYISGVDIPGQTTVLPDGNTQVIVTAPTFIPLPPPTVGELSYPAPITVISGSTYLDISSPTTIPFIPGVAIPGETTILPDGSTQVIVTASTMIQVPPKLLTELTYPFATTVISGSTYLSLTPTTLVLPLIPGLSINVPGKTTILPNGATEVVVTASTLLSISSLPPMTIISGSTYLEVGSTLVALPLTPQPQTAYPFATTEISGSTYLELFPTTIPLLSGITIPGKTTVLANGQTEVIVTASALFPLPSILPHATYPFPTTIISGTTYLEIPPTTLPYPPLPGLPGLSIPGKTTILSNGSTEIIITASTNIPLPTPGSNSDSTSNSADGSGVAGSVSTAPQTGTAISTGNSAASGTGHSTLTTSTRSMGVKRERVAIWWLPVIFVAVRLRLF